MKRNCQLALMTTMAAVGCLVAVAPLQAIVIHQWAVRQAGFHSQDEVRGLAVDSAGNIYVGAVAWRGYTTGDDFELLKYAPDGAMVWRSFFTGAGPYGDSPEDLAMDTTGNVYLCGAGCQQSLFGNDYATVKFNPQGQLIWAVWYNGPANGYDEARALALDDQGNIYVTGISTGVGTGWDYTTIKYNAEGMEQWVARYDGAGHRYDEGVDLALDGEGNIYVTGYSDVNLTGSANHEIVTIKYNTQGVQQWEASFGRPGSALDAPVAIAVDPDGNAYVTGNSDLSGATSAAIISVKYNSVGMQQWTAQYAGTGGNGAHVNDMVLDAENDVIFTGVYYMAASPSVFLTVKYSTNGTPLWDEVYQGPSPYYYIYGGNSLTTDVGRNVYVTGAVGDWWGDPECTTLKYNLTGNLEWSALHICDSVSAEFGYTVGRSIILDNQGDVIVAGGICMGGGIEDADIHTIKYRQIPGDVIVGMIPTVSPVQIPANGGRFSYHLMTINNVMDSLDVDVWWQIRFPPPPARTSLIGPITEVLPLGSTSAIRTQNVPGSVPAGTYLYIVNAGDYSGIVWASDTLTVIKLPTGDTPLVEDWTNAGEDFNGGANSVASTSGSGATPTMIVSPNPFNPTTAISCELRAASVYRCTIRRDDWWRP